MLVDVRIQCRSSNRHPSPVSRHAERFNFALGSKSSVHPMSKEINELLLDYIVSNNTYRPIVNIDFSDEIQQSARSRGNIKPRIDGRI
jgi:hypothetical protein